MTDVLLLNQYFTSGKESRDYIPAMLPVNLLYIGTYIRERGIDCRIVELGAFDPTQTIEEGNRFRSGLPDSAIRDIVKRERPRIVGVGCMFTRHFRDAYAICRLVKEVDPSIVFVLGGNHVSSFPIPAMKQAPVDFVVVGEGERTFFELCNVILKGGKDFRGIRGLVFRDESGRIIENERRELIPDINELNVDYDLVDALKYADVLCAGPFFMRHPSLGITTSRGCPGNCVYCTVKNVYGRTWRGKSAKKTVDEIELLHRKYGIREFAFMDDSASLDKKRWNAICDEIIERKLDIRWMTPNGIAHWTLDKPTLDRMKKAGCYRITFGIESGNAETRKYLGKPYPLEQAREMLQYANRIGMWTICTNILGFPYETREMMEDTITFAKKSGTDFAAFFLLVPHISSDVYRDFKKEGLLDLDRLFAGDSFSDEEYEQMGKMINDGGTATKYFSADELKAIQMRAYRSFIAYRALSCLFNPLRLLRKIGSREDLLYMLRLLGVGLKIFVRSFRKVTTKKLLYTKFAPK